MVKELSSLHTTSLIGAEALSITPCNGNINKRRKSVVHLFHCILCGQVTSVEKTPKDERVMPLDGLGQRVHFCSSNMASPYRYRLHRQQSQLGKTMAVGSSYTIKMTKSALLDVHGSSLQDTQRVPIQSIALQQSETPLTPQEKASENVAVV